MLNTSMADNFSQFSFSDIIIDVRPHKRRHQFMLDKSPTETDFKLTVKQKELYSTLCCRLEPKPKWDFMFYIQNIYLPNRCDRRLGCLASWSHGLNSGSLCAPARRRGFRCGRVGMCPGKEDGNAPANIGWLSPSPAICSSPGRHWFSYRAFMLIRCALRGFCCGEVGGVTLEDLGGDTASLSLLISESILKAWDAVLFVAIMFATTTKFATSLKCNYEDVHAESEIKQLISQQLMRNLYKYGSSTIQVTDYNKISTVTCTKDFGAMWLVIAVMDLTSDWLIFGKEVERAIYSPLQLWFILISINQCWLLIYRHTKDLDLNDDRLTK